ncbi:Phosphatidylinositol 3,4,5-trisphosphate-dependent Rac exchanger 2 protein [Rhizophlyctis rosea]|nr:Phosphatidylinositol 3,4,5-trisphosphate-dependent Rac exchanger 2 protein [Rhizophlyctis rosea]
MTQSEQTSLGPKEIMANRLGAVTGFDNVTAQLASMQDADLEFAPTLVPGRGKNGGFLLAAQSQEDLRLPEGEVEEPRVVNDGVGDGDALDVIPPVTNTTALSADLAAISHESLNATLPSSETHKIPDSLETIKPLLKAVDTISLGTRGSRNDDENGDTLSGKASVKRRPASIMVPMSVSRDFETDAQSNAPTISPHSPSKKAHRLSYNGHEDDHIAAFATLGRSTQNLVASPQPEDDGKKDGEVDASLSFRQESRQDSSGSLADLYKYERPEDRRLLQRIHVVKELRDSERLYVADLRTLVESCFDRLNAASWLPSEKRFMLMRNANELYKFQQEFLAEMEEALVKFNPVVENQSPVEELEVPVPVAQVFLKMKEKFNVYKDYCTQHDGAIKILTEYEKRPEMISFLQEFKGTAHTKLDLKDYLIKPVQRLCRYPLLLQELIKTTDADAPDYVDLISAYSIMQEVVVDIDSAKFMMENLQRTDRFFTRLENTLQIDAPKRMDCGEMLYGGGLLFIDHPDISGAKIKYRGVFVFPEFLFVVKPKRSSVYNLKLCIPLATYQFRYLGSRETPLPYAFRLKHAEAGHHFDFGTQSDRERGAWGEVLTRLTASTPTSRARDPALFAEAQAAARAHIKQMKRTSSTGSVSSLSTMASVDEMAAIIAAERAAERDLPPQQQHHGSTRRKFWRQSSVDSDRGFGGSGTMFVGRRPSVDSKLSDVVTVFPEATSTHSTPPPRQRGFYEMISPMSNSSGCGNDATSVTSDSDRSSIRSSRQPPRLSLRNLSEPLFPAQRSPDQPSDALSPTDPDEARHAMLNGPALRPTRSVTSFRAGGSFSPTGSAAGAHGLAHGHGHGHGSGSGTYGFRSASMTGHNTSAPMLNRYPSRSSARSMASWTSDSSVGVAPAEEDEEGEEEGGVDGGKGVGKEGKGGVKQVYRTWSQIFSKKSGKRNLREALGLKRGQK